MQSITDLPGVLFDYLKKMDKEASEVAIDVPHRGVFRPGLCSYAWYYRCPGNSHSEDACRDRLCKFLNEEGIKAECDPEYPRPPGKHGGSAKKGDLKIWLPNGSTVFMEMKVAWKYKTDDYEKPSSNEKNCKNHLPKGVADDFLKIAEADADYLAILLLGFDIPGTRLVIQDSDIKEMKEIVKMKEKLKFGSPRHWKEHPSEPWNGKDVRDARVRCWLWWRPRNHASLT